MDVIISVGGRFHAIKLAEQLQRRGHLKRIVTTKSWYCKDIIDKDKYIAILFPELAGEAVRRLPILKNLNLYSYVKDNLFDWMAGRHLGPCDLFVGWNGFALYSLEIARSYGAKVVIERGSCHPLVQERLLEEEYDKYGMKRRPIHRGLLEKQLKEYEEADAIAIPSEFVRRSFSEMGFEERKLVMIPYGVDLSDFKQIPKQDDIFRVLFVGNIGIRKGIHYLLKAFSNVALDRSELLIIGTVDESVRTLIEPYKDRFKHIRFVPHESLYQYYSNSSVFVLPSIEEGSAMVTYEAMACGLPCIVSTNTGAVVRDGQDGFVVPIRDVEAIEEKLRFFYENEDARREMGASAKAYVQQFTWDQYGEKIVRAYKKIALA